ASLSVGGSRNSTPAEDSRTGTRPPRAFSCRFLRARCYPGPRAEASADGPVACGDEPRPERKPSGARGGDHSRTMELRAGTSGFSYAEWKGKFYPPGTKEADFLRYYATKLDAVEINSTFYRMPRPSVLA